MKNKTFDGHKIDAIYLSPGCLRNAGVAFPFFYERLVSSVLGPAGPVHAGPAGPGVVDIVGLGPRPDDRVIRAAKIRRGAVITVLIILSNLQWERSDAITNEEKLSRLTFNPKYSIYVTEWRNG